MILSVAICCRVHLYAEGIRRLVGDDNEIRTIGIADNDDEIRNLMQYKPHVVISDLESCKTALQLLSNSEDSNVLLLNNIDKLQNEDVKNMIRDGLRGILPPEANSSLLIKAVKKLHDGELWLDNQTVRDVLIAKEKTELKTHLTKKEIEILKLICTGHTNKEIAKKLYISEQTVKSHCNHLFKKFAVKNRLKLALVATQYSPENIKGHKLQ